METPFPGMDPYLEMPGLWPDVHSSIISAIRDQLQAAIAPNYRAVITPYVAFESLEIAPVRMVVPDVGIFEHERDEPGGMVAVAMATAPLIVPAVMEIATRYARIELRAINDETLVTAIELLSPVNKRLGPDSADAYEKKRQELFMSGVHLLEMISCVVGVVRSWLVPSRCPTTRTSYS